MTNRQRAPKSPETFSIARLAAADFDNTIALTSEPSPAGIGVIEAYELAIGTVFDSDQLAIYKKNGGLRNRAPLEVVSELMPDAYVTEIKTKEHELNKTKLDVLLGEIGTRFANGQLWPRPVPGYLEFRERLHDSRDEGIRVDDAVISSGHESFIKRTFDVWTVSYPTHIVAVETLDRLGRGHAVKPSSELMDVTRGFWRVGYGLPFWQEASTEELDRIIYTGDDPVKDGGLAANSGVSFIHMSDIHSSRERWQSMATRSGLIEAVARGFLTHG